MVLSVNGTRFEPLGNGWEHRVRYDATDKVVVDFYHLAEDDDENDDEDESPFASLIIKNIQDDTHMSSANLNGWKVVMSKYFADLSNSRIEIINFGFEPSARTLSLIHI